MLLPWQNLWQRRCRAFRERRPGEPYWGRCELRRRHEGDHALERGFDTPRWSSDWVRVGDNGRDDSVRTCGARKTENGKHYHCVGPADHLGDHAWAQDLMGDLKASLETAPPCYIRGCVGVAEHRWWTRDGYFVEFCERHNTLRRARPPVDHDWQHLSPADQAALQRSLSRSKPTIANINEA